MQFFEDTVFGGWVAKLEKALDDAAAVSVAGELMDLADDGGGDETDVFRGDALNGLLDDVVAVLILDAGEDVALQLFDDADLLIKQDVVEDLFHISTGAIGGRNGVTFCTTRHPYT